MTYWFSMMLFCSVLYRLSSQWGMTVTVIPNICTHLKQLLLLASHLTLKEQRKKVHAWRTGKCQEVISKEHSRSILTLKMSAKSVRFLDSAKGDEDKLIVNTLKVLRANFHLLEDLVKKGKVRGELFFFFHILVRSCLSMHCVIMVSKTCFINALVFEWKLDHTES